MAWKAQNAEDSADEPSDESPNNLEPGGAWKMDERIVQPSHGVVNRLKPRYMLLSRLDEIAKNIVEEI